MPTSMIAIELIPDTIDHVMAVAAFVWPTLTTDELVEAMEDARLEGELYYFIPKYIGKFASPHMCPDAVLLREDVLKEDFDYEIIDRTKPFTITRKA